MLSSHGGLLTIAMYKIVHAQLSIKQDPSTNQRSRFEQQRQPLDMRCSDKYLRHIFSFN